MKLSPVPERTEAGIRALVEGETEKIAEKTIAGGLRTFLIDPRRELRTWDWQKPHVQYPV